MRAAVTVDQVVEHELRRVGERASDLSPAFEEILDEFEDWEEAQFRTEGAFLGTPWEPLAPSTIRSKRAAGYPLDILVATGQLRDSLTGHGSAAVRRVSRDEASLGTDVPYAKYQHRRRPLIAVDEIRRRSIVSRIQEHIVKRRRPA